MAATVEAIDLKYVPRMWQKECHRHRKRFTVLALHRRAGKTELAIMELVNAAIKFTDELGLFFYVAPYLKQAKIIAWARLKQRLAPLIERSAVEINESELSARFTHNGAIIRIYGGDNPDGMRGVRLDGCVIDEVAQIKPEVWNDILQPALSDRKGWALFIGTPSGVNLFSELFYAAKKKPQWYSNLYTVNDTDALDPDEVERLKEDMTETSYAREYLCDFSAAGDDQLISIADVEEGIARRYTERDINYAPRIVGVDPARFGDDRSVIFRRQGLQAFPPQVMHGLDNMALAGRVARVIEDWNPDAVFIDAGNGSGVIDRLRQLNYEVTEVSFGGKPDDVLYINKRTEMWFRMRDWLRTGGGLPNDNLLRQDLAAPIYWYNPKNQYVLEPKEDIKARGLPSPDRGDALALTFAFSVEKRPEMHRPTHETGERSRIQRVVDYDPYSRNQIRS